MSAHRFFPITLAAFETSKSFRRRPGTERLRLSLVTLKSWRFQIQKILIFFKKPAL
jgi:hypothetical protein